MAGSHTLVGNRPRAEINAWQRGATKAKYDRASAAWKHSEVGLPFTWFLGGVTEIQETTAGPTLSLAGEGTVLEPADGDHHRNRCRHHRRR
jgi:hypothetical protein